MAAKTCSPQRSEPTSGWGSVSRVNQPDVTRLERVRGQLAAHGLAVEEERVQRHPGEAEAQAVEDGDEAHRLDDDAGLLLHLLHDDLGRRVADVAPPGRVEPDARVGALNQQQLALVVADGGTDGHLGRDVARDTLADGVHPLLHQPAGVVGVLVRAVRLRSGCPPPP